MQIDEKKLQVINNNILFGIKEINKISSAMLNVKDVGISLGYLVKLVGDLEKDSNELNLIKSYIIKEETVNETVKEGGNEINGR